MKSVTINRADFGGEMTDRRAFLALATSTIALATPAIASASYRVPAQFLPTEVSVNSGYKPGELFVVPRSHFLYFISGPGKAMRYGVGVGRAGLEFTGSARIGRKAEWPSWRPTDEMIEREPEKYAKYADGVPGGPDNPLGSRALYLYQNGVDTYFRIHGTTAPRSIGRSVSNGCIRMINQHVEDLYERVPLGARVTVL